MYRNTTLCPKLKLLTVVRRLDTSCLHSQARCSSLAFFLWQSGRLKTPSDAPVMEISRQDLSNATDFRCVCSAVFCSKTTQDFTAAGMLSCVLYVVPGSSCRTRWPQARDRACFLGDEPPFDIYWVYTRQRCCPVLLSPPSGRTCAR